MIGLFIILCCSVVCVSIVRLQLESQGFFDLVPAADVQLVEYEQQLQDIEVERFSSNAVNFIDVKNKTLTLFRSYPGEDYIQVEVINNYSHNPAFPRYF